MENQETVDLTAKREVTNEAFAVLIKNVYAWMTLALGITGIAALYVSNNQVILAYLFEHMGLVFGLMIGELVLAIIFAACFRRMSFNVASILFGLYALFTGISLGMVFLTFTSESIASTFFVTAGTFGAMSLFGYFTKRDLSAWGRYLLMALIGLVIATVVNLFMQNAKLMWITTYVGVVVFVLLTAYDTQKIKALLADSEEVNEHSLKLALYGSFMLYLDFINLFLDLLKIMGKRK